MSDLHFEFGDKFVPKHTGEDALILAGDISTDPEEILELAKNYLASSPAETHVILIAGNHEYFGHTINFIEDYWSKIQIPQIHYLQNQSIVLNGTRFFGTTLWTDMLGNNNKAKSVAKIFIGDYMHIRDITPETTVALHQKARRILTETVRKSSEPVVVISHHLPSYDCVQPQYVGQQTNCAFACSDLEDLFLEENIIYWIHGHTHSTVKCRKGNVPIVANPRGYVKKNIPENLDFDIEFMIEIP